MTGSGPRGGGAVSYARGTPVTAGGWPGEWGIEADGSSQPPCLDAIRLYIYVYIYIYIYNTNV